MAANPKDIYAFPFVHADANLQYTGMSLRDYFAGKALQQAWEAYDKGYTGDPEDVTPSIAKHAYQIADAMLAERLK